LRVLVTGAGGFVGHCLTEELARDGHEVISVHRRAGLYAPTGKILIIPEIANHEWRGHLEGVDCVVHLAARVHNPSDGLSSEQSYFRTNRDATAQLVRACVASEVKRFVFLSTVKVMGECSADHSFTEGDCVKPMNPYARSKAEAELAIMEGCDGTGMTFSILRPPLVYGPGVRANFLRLMDLVYRQVPLPFGLANNERSFVFVRNLTHALSFCMTESTANRTLFVSDGENLSTSDLIERLAGSLGVSALQIPVPVSLIRLAGRIIRKGEAVDRLLGSLIVSSQAIRECGWCPPYTLDEGLATTTNWYLSRYTR